MFNRPRPGNTNRQFLSEQAGVSSITTNNGSRSIMSGLGFTDLLSAHVPLADDTRRSLMNSTTRALYHSFPTHCWSFFLATRARYKNPRHHADLCPWNETFSHVEPEPNFLTDGKNVIKWPADFSDVFYLQLTTTSTLAFSFLLQWKPSYCYTLRSFLFFYFLFFLFFSFFSMKYGKWSKSESIIVLWMIYRSEKA